MTTAALSLEDFCRHVLRKSLWPHQLAAAESDDFIMAIAGGRRSGKSFFAQAKAIYTAATTRNARVLVISPAVENTRNFVRDLAELIRDSELSGSVVDDQAQLVTFTNGSEIRCVAATSGQIRGRGRNLRLAIVDEAAFVPSSVWRDLYYTLFDLRSEGSQALLACSPWGPPTHFYRQSFERGMAGEEGYASFRWTMLDNPTLDAKFIEREREHIAPSEAAAEIDGIWSDSAGSLFSQALLESVSAPVEVPPLAELGGEATGIVGIDWGVSYDRSAAVGLFRLPIAALNPDRERKPTFLALPYTWRQGEELNRVVDELVAHLSPFRYITAETNGIGSFPSTELRRRAVEKHRRGEKRSWNLHATTAGSKTTGYALILGLMETGKLILPKDPTLLRQLASIRFEQRERGFTHIGTDDDATHDDVCDALMLGTCPYRLARVHRTVCHLGALASSQKAVPDAAVPEVACPVVETGNGVRLPLKPTLQSVGSQKFSLYAPPKETRQGFQAGRFFVHIDSPVGVTNA